ERHQPFLPPLAVIPPQYVRPNVNAAPAPPLQAATSAAPNAVPPVSSTVSFPWSPPVLLPESEPSVALAPSWQSPPPAAVAKAVVTAPVPITSAAASNETTASHDKSDSTAERQAHLDKAQSDLIE